MSKKVVILLLLTLLAALLLYEYRVYKYKPEPLVGSQEGLVLSVTSAPIASPGSSWKTFEDVQLGFRIKFPEKMEVKKEVDAVVLFDEDIHISITQGLLLENETLNTHIEKQINQKVEKIAGQFKLVDTISPIAIDSLTSLTYKSEEVGDKFVYFYVPQGNSRYLLITNKIKPLTDQTTVSLSDEIIYTLDLMP
jgi:hypothetical protein